MDDRERIDTTRGDDRRAAGGLKRLDELDDYTVADHDEDIRGWNVFTPDGRKVGKVEELIVDTSALKARYMEVKVEKDIAGTDDDRWTVVPVGTARLDENKNEVIIDRLPTTALFTAEQRKREPLSREVELSLREQYGATTTGLAADTAPARDDDFYSHAIYDDTRLRRARERGTDPYLTREERPSDRRM